VLELLQVHATDPNPIRLIKNAHIRARIKSVRDNRSFAAPGLDHFPLHPQLVPWAAFFRRFRG